MISITNKLIAQVFTTKVRLLGCSTVLYCCFPTIKKVPAHTLPKDNLLNTVAMCDVI